MYVSWQNVPNPLCIVIDVLYYSWRWRQKKDNAIVHNTVKGDVVHLSGYKLFFFQLWLAYLPSHQPELTFAPDPDAEISPQQVDEQLIHTLSLYIRPLRGYRSSSIFAAEVVSSTAKIQLAGNAQSATLWEQALIMRAQLITISLCLCYFLLSPSGVILLLPPSSSIFPNPIMLSWFLPPLVTFA